MGGLGQEVDGPRFKSQCRESLGGARAGARTTSEHRRGTHEQGAEPPIANMEPCNELVAHSAPKRDTAVKKMTLEKTIHAYVLSTLTKNSHQPEHFQKTRYPNI